ncbi:acetyl-CoA C-acetyltransferase [Paenibacillus hemerocallicola]|uniref:acetyl-CoA C-acetyltransferase n=1 Tax=Paenibacillus hemerocallicola TaxID=1172614 RepID=A0A5C4TBE9_9BACL|nr:acetyl-CoA C-acetyltransferase [Paenibacillus hemerocallicola]TNJ65976.1 acetyl-CoA C-acetyltransferase [Paenibacillus hemerocallicola]
MEEIYILGGSRTPFGSFGGALRDVGAAKLGVIASKAAMNRSGVEPGEIDFAVVGNVIHSSSNASYMSRHISLEAGLPVASTALTVNRLCGSGMQAVISAAQSIMLGEGEAGLACGAENMSLSPFALRGSRFGTGIRSPQLDDMLQATLTDEFCGIGMGMTAENLAEKYKITREEQDEFAYLSHRRASSARRNSVFAEEIAPVEIADRKGNFLVEADEHIREDTSLAALGKLRPAFMKDGTVTSGNASGINDGAASLVVSGGSFVARHNKKPLARIVSWAVSGVEPAMMGIGPATAIPTALIKANLALHDIDRFEVNEAFAAQYLSVEKILGLDREKTNVHGGAIALGHPVGASGARILLSLALELRRSKLRYGVASLCIGGGQGIAMVIEAC